MPEGQPISSAEYEARLAQRRQQEAFARHQAQQARAASAPQPQYGGAPIPPRPQRGANPGYPGQPVGGYDPRQAQVPPRGQQPPRGGSQPGRPQPGRVPTTGQEIAQTRTAKSDVQRHAGSDVGTLEPLGDKKPGKTRLRVIGTALAVLALAGIVYTQQDRIPFLSHDDDIAMNLHGNENITGSIKTVGENALNIENCKKEGAAVATLVVESKLPLMYMLTPPAEGAQPTTVKPYMISSTLAKTIEQVKAQKETETDPEKVKAMTNYLTLLENAETESGYPEFTLNDMPLKIYACADPNATSAVTNEGGKYRIDMSQIDLTVQLPQEYDSVLQEKTANVQDLKEGQFATYPTRTFLSPNAELYTDASVKAANDAHANPDQQIGALNVSVKTIVEEMQDADPTSTFNTLANFPNNIPNMYELIKRGITQRISTDIPYNDYTWSVANYDFQPTVDAKQPTAVFLDSDPAKRLNLKSVQVVLGDVANDPASTVVNTEGDK